MPAPDRQRALGGVPGAAARAAQEQFAARAASRRRRAPRRDAPGAGRAAAATATQAKSNIVPNPALAQPPRPVAPTVVQAAPGRDDDAHHAPADAAGAPAVGHAEDRGDARVRATARPCCRGAARRRRRSRRSPATSADATGRRCRRAGRSGQGDRARRRRDDAAPARRRAPPGARATPAPSLAPTHGLLRLRSDAAVRPRP